jgi:hypothetical protein
VKLPLPTRQAVILFDPKSALENANTLKLL